jgi:hypothetical protein
MRKEQVKLPTETGATIRDRNEAANLGETPNAELARESSSSGEAFRPRVDRRARRLVTCARALK